MNDRKDKHVSKNCAGQGRLKAFLEWMSKQGYGIENHTVLTEDGYVLNVQRITKGIFIQYFSSMLMEQKYFLSASVDLTLIKIRLARSCRRSRST